MICWWPNACAPERGRTWRPPNLPRRFLLCVYESRGGDGPSPQLQDPPTAGLRRALAATRRLSGQLRADENRHRIAPTREPDEGFVTAAYRWATTGDLAEALHGRRGKRGLGRRDGVVGR